MRSHSHRRCPQDVALANASRLNETSTYDTSTHPPQDGPRRTRSKATKPQFANDHFRDVSETGVWGRVTAQEIYLVGFLAATMVLSCLGYIVSAVIGYHSSTSVAANYMQPESQAELPFLDEGDLYAALLDIVGKHPHFTENGRRKTTMHLPDDFEMLTANDAYSTAAEWLVYGDPLIKKTNKTIVPRFVLATTYFANNGRYWLSSEGWLSAADVCEWEGVVCEMNRIVQVDLANNNLSGSLHSVWGMLDGCISLLLGGNALTGTIHEIMATPSDLHILRLQNNRLSGSIPSSFKPKLDTMYVHGNDNLTGVWPDCESFKYFGIDCDRIDCECCKFGHNCF